MGAYRTSMGDVTDESDTVVIRRVDANVQRLVTELEADAQRRKITLVMTGIGVVFAAAKLGFIALPHIRAWRGNR